MSDVDVHLESLRQIKADFASFCQAHGAVTEADTRAKIIDRMLKEVCDWPEAAISREQRVERDGEDGTRKHGSMDYVLTVQNRRTVVVEAKHEGVPFTFAYKPRQDNHIRSLGARASLETCISRASSHH